MKNFMEHADLLSALSKADIGALRNVRYTPTSFDPSDKTILPFPYARETWESAERAFRLFGTRLVMARFPYFWQMHSLLHTACRRVSAVLYINVLTNAPLGLAAIRDISADTMVSGVKAAELFAHEVQDAKMLDRLSWLIIHDAKDAWDLPEILKKGSESVAQEVHLFPGVVLLEQCEEQMRAMSGLFHTHEDFAWDIEGGNAFISADGPVPLKKYKLPFALKESGRCGCGKTAYEKDS